MKKLTLFVILTLAFVASVFVCSAQADSICPWSLCVTITNGADSCLYDYESNLRQVTDATYLGRVGKMRLYDELTKLGLSEDAVYEYVLPGFGNILKHFSYVEQPRIDASVSVANGKFCYKTGQNGVEIDKKTLFCTLALKTGKICSVELPTKTDVATTVSDLKKITVLKGEFSTSFANSGANRKHNIALCASKLNGVVILPDERFSFNDVVGARTLANGYKNAVVISDGNYVEGVGGGVCQVSTTLYNALLLANFVPSAHRHTLVSSYVLPGFDAMVAYGTTDMTFVNDTEHPLYIFASTQNNRILFRVYGEPNKYRVERQSDVTRTPFDTIFVDSVDPQLVYDDQFKVVKNGSDGVISKSYLLLYEDDKLVEKRLIRTDNYKRVDKIVERGKIHRPQSQTDGGQGS